MKVKMDWNTSSPPPLPTVAAPLLLPSTTAIIACFGLTVVTVAAAVAITIGTVMYVKLHQRQHVDQYSQQWRWQHNDSGSTRNNKCGSCGEEGRDSSSISGTLSSVLLSHPWQHGGGVCFDPNLVGRCMPALTLSRIFLCVCDLVGCALRGFWGG